MINRKNVIIKMALILLFVLTIGSHTVYAQFPERGDQIVIDSTGKIEQVEINRLREYIEPLSHSYIVVFVDKVEPDGNKYVTDLFSHYALTPDQMLLVVNTTDGQLFTHFGEKLGAEGLTDELILSKNEVIFSPYAKDGKVLIGVRNFIQALERELDNIKAQKERETSLVVTEEPKNEVQEEDSSMWSYLVMGSIALVLLFVIISFWVRRNIRKQVDSLESSKINLENRPFSTELARVKGLKMAGETEIRFEKWRNEWEEILTVTLPNIEETLVDIDELADSYRFIKARKMIAKTQNRLRHIEEDLDRIVMEIDELTSSEKNNRFKIEELHEEYQKIKSALQKNSIALGVSYPLYYEKFKKIGGWFESFNEAQENGDYLSAQDILEAIEEVLKQIREGIENIPALVQEVEVKVPQQIREVENAVQEMIEKGYILDHTDVLARLQKLRGKKEFVQYLEDGQIEKTKEWIDQTLQEIEEIFGVLEQEVETKAFVMQNTQLLPAQLEEISEMIGKVSFDIQTTKLSYSWESEWEDLHTQLKQTYEELKETYSQIEGLSEEIQQVYPKALPLINTFHEQRDKVMALSKEINDVLSTLREDELKAGELTQKLKQSLVKIKVNLRKSNLPGIPDHLQSGLEMAEEVLQELDLELRKIPLDMNRIQFQVKEAKSQVESITQVAKTTIAQAEKAESYIQYASRFRRNSQELKEIIDAAESSFRSYQYKEAVELAEDALDMVDKRWRDKFKFEEESVS